MEVAMSDVIINKCPKCGKQGCSYSGEDCHTCGHCCPLDDGSPAEFTFNECGCNSEEDYIEDFG